jgi:hypothetical protein
MWEWKRWEERELSGTKTKIFLDVNYRAEVKARKGRKSHVSTACRVKSGNT